MDLQSLYQPLDPKIQEIRLLEIHPAVDLTSPLKVSIIKESLQSSKGGSYRVLSYVWNDWLYLARRGDEPAPTVTIEGVQEPQPIDVNLESALRHIRHSSEKTLIWADALCINQQEIQEKNHQVRLMAQIYQKSSEVIAWLGPEFDNSNSGMDLIGEWATSEELEAIGAFDTNRTFTGNTSFEDAMALLKRSVPSAFDTETYHALWEIAVRPYWTRAWTCQELALSESVTVYCGQKSHPIDFFFRICQSMVKFYSNRTSDATIEMPFIPKFPARVRIISNFVRKSRLRFRAGLKTLSLAMLTALRDLGSSDPRDKVFALLSLLDLSGPHSDLIAPDYGKSVEDVYIDTAKYLILAGHTLHVLNWVDPEHSNSLPSWVPDWSRRSTINERMRLRKESEDKFLWLEFAPQMVRFSAENALVAKGAILDVVTETFDRGLTPLWHGPEARRTFVEEFLAGSTIKNRTALSAYFRLAVLGPTDTLKRDVDPLEEPEFWRFAALFLHKILLDLQDSPESFELISIMPELLSDKDNLRSVLVSNFIGLDTLISEQSALLSHLDLLHDGHDFFSERIKPNLTVHVESYRLFRTAKGYLGLAPKGVTQGDEICHLAAHASPFVLRPIESGYQNLGDCEVLDLDTRLSLNSMTQMGDIYIR